MSKNDFKSYSKNDKLSKKQLLWIDEYIKTDDYTTASRNAGYKGNDNSLRHIGYENSKRFKELINSRRQELYEKMTTDNIAELEDIFKFWTKTFQNEDEKMQDRIKASELLAKAKGGFIEKKEVKVVDTDWFIDE